MVSTDRPIERLRATNDLELVALLLVAILKVCPEDTVTVVRIDRIDHGECKVEIFKGWNLYVELLETRTTGSNRLSGKTEVVRYDLSEQSATNGLKGEVTSNA